jgi:hypothetical protein
MIKMGLPISVSPHAGTRDTRAELWMHEMCQIHNTYQYLLRSFGLAFVITIGVLSSIGSGGGELYISPCFPFPEEWCTGGGENPPTAPTQLITNALSPSEISLTWSEATDNDGYVIGYKIYRDGSYIDYVSSSTTNYTDTELYPSKLYCYTVSATDNAGNESAKSNQSCSTTFIDTQPPSVPATLKINVITNDTIELTWEPSTDDTLVISYNIYRDDNYLTDSLTTSITDTNLDLDTYYCYTVSAIDAGGNESEKTNSVCASTLWARTIDNIGNTSSYGDNTSLSLESDGKAHIAYYDPNTQTLKYATNMSGVWDTRIIDTGVYGYVSLAMDSFNNVHISYCSGGIYNLKYATNSSGSWQIFTLDDYWAGHHTSIYVDQNDKVHISYYGYQDGQLRYATNISNNWEIYSIDDIVVGNTSIALDASGYVHISYYDSSNNDLKYITNQSGNWVPSILASDGNVGAFNSISIDSNDKLHILYNHVDTRAINHVTNATGQWVHETLIDSNTSLFGMSFTLDPSDNLHFTYIYTDAFTSVFNYATNSSGSLEIYLLDNEPFDEVGNSIAVDAENRAHISSIIPPTGEVIYTTYLAN